MNITTTFEQAVRATRYSNRFSDEDIEVLEEYLANEFKDNELSLYDLEDILRDCECYSLPEYALADWDCEDEYDMALKGAIMLQNWNSGVCIVIDTSYDNKLSARKAS